MLMSLPLLVVRREMDRGALFVPWLVSAAGLGLWFLTAPDPRFAHGLLFGFAFLPVSAALRRAGFAGWTPRRRAALAFAGLGTFVLIVVPADLFLIAKGKISPPSLLFQSPSRVASTLARRTASGLAVLIPVADDRCWNAPLPCTPTFRPDLRAERHPSGRIRRFTLSEGPP